MNIQNLKRETRYGMPAADQILFNRYYVLGYSYYFRQAKWALEIVSPKNPALDRLDNFRSDFRIPEMFRADLEDYQNSGFNRGHLVASANTIEDEIQNSETFLLSNMSPQKPGFNKGIWKKLESEVRRLDNKSKYFETYVISGPIFYFDKPVNYIGTGTKNEVSIPIPNAYFKSILAESNTGALHMWSFVIENKKTEKSLKTFQVSTNLVEKLAGIKLWEQLDGTKIEREKNKTRKMW